MARHRLARYQGLRDQLSGLLAQTRDPVARRATLVALLHHKLPDVSWTGFYMLREGELVVDAYQGMLACLVLEPHRGVCWAGVDQGEPVIVPDVDAFPGHIPCDSRTRSEIVVPHRGPDDEIIGVLDLDSRKPARFDEADAWGLALVLGLLETRQ
jgi:L-methionine (R)-S-oxide reductase